MTVCALAQVLHTVSEQILASRNVLYWFAQVRFPNAREQRDTCRFRFITPQYNVHGRHTQKHNGNGCANLRVRVPVR